MTLVTKILNDEGLDDKHDDADLLKSISDIHKNIECRRKIEWMPAHLDEPKNRKKLESFLEQGGTRDMIKGNCGADDSAKEGAEIHGDITKLADRASDLRAITVAAQRMYIRMWKLQYRKLILSRHA